VRNETIVSDSYEFADEGVRLDLAPLTDNHAALYLDERPNKTVVPDRTAVKIYGFYNCHSVAESHMTMPAFRIVVLSPCSP
jgi:hypothetical protein